MKYYITEKGARFLDHLKSPEGYRGRLGEVLDHLKSPGGHMSRLGEVLERIEAEEGQEDFLPEEQRILDWLKSGGYIDTTEQVFRRMGLR